MAANREVRIFLPIHTKNPLNGACGNSRIAAILRTRTRKAQRHETGLIVRGTLLKGLALDLEAGVKVTITRVAPSRGLDPHDGLGAALKSIIDGVCDALDIRDDRDPRVTWVLGQRRGVAREYRVEVVIQQVVAS